ncbi:unnamed protein product [Prunus armeniaca]
MTVDHEIYFVECVDFAESFIQLCIKEDDVPLHLLCVPCCAEQDEKEKVALEDSNGNLLFRVSDLFNPALLFHLFLLELSYDHQVLLDYLISKDTRIRCASYLVDSFFGVLLTWYSGALQCLCILPSALLMTRMYVAVFVFHYPHYHSLGVGGGTSAPKQEEVKRLPGGKIKKKVRLLKIFVFEDH